MLQTAACPAITRNIHLDLCCGTCLMIRVLPPRLLNYLQKLQNHLYSVSQHNSLSKVCLNQLWECIIHWGGRHPYGRKSCVFHNISSMVILVPIMCWKWHCKAMWFPLATRLCCFLTEENIRDVRSFRNPHWHLQRFVFVFSTVFRTPGPLPIKPKKRKIKLNWTSHLFVFAYTKIKPLLLIVPVII